MILRATNLRDQEVDGSNPFAPTISLLKRSNSRIQTVGSICSPFERLLAVGDPDIFYLNGMIQEPAAFTLFGVKPVDGAAFVGEYLL